MKSPNNILLSICIPTFNRATYLKICLECIFSQISMDDSIEVIVSNNCSTDDTDNVISQYINHPKLKVVNQLKNVGPIRNGAELISLYATGKYCWYVGDDDYIKNGAISELLTLLSHNPESDFFYVDIENHELDVKKIELSETLKYIQSQEYIDDLEIVNLEKFEYLLNPIYSDLFLGEIMACIFSRKLWLKQENIIEYLDLEYLSSLETSYLHCVVFANQFMNSKAIYVATPVIYVDNRAREWSAKASYILVEHILTLLFLYKKNGLSKNIYRICTRHYIRLTLPVIVKFLFNFNIDYRKKISFNRYFLFLLSNPILTVQTIFTRGKIKLFSFFLT